MLEDSASSYQQVLGLLFGLHLGLWNHESFLVLLDIIELEHPSMSIFLLFLGMGRSELECRCSCSGSLLDVSLLNLSMGSGNSISSSYTLMLITPTKDVASLMLGVLYAELIAAYVVYQLT